MSSGPSSLFESRRYSDSAIEIERVHRSSVDIVTNFVLLFETLFTVFPIRKHF